MTGGGVPRGTPGAKCSGGMGKGEAGVFPVGPQHRCFVNEVRRFCVSSGGVGFE